MMAARTGYFSCIEVFWFISVVVMGWNQLKEEVLDKVNTEMGLQGEIIICSADTGSRRRLY